MAGLGSSGIWGSLSYVTSQIDVVTPGSWLELGHWSHGEFP